MTTILQKLSSNCKGALKNAFILAQKSEKKEIEPDHVILGISQQKGSLGAEILNNAGIFLKITATTNNIKTKNFKFSASCKKLLKKAALVAAMNNHHYIGTEHLLAGVLKNDYLKNSKYINQKKYQKKLEKQVNTVLNSISKFPDIADALNSFPLPIPGKRTNLNFNKTKKKPGVLDFFAVNLTDPFVQKEIDPVIGREDEILRLIQILSRKTKNNPLLLGDAGVGKTAIVEGLAKKIITGDIPDILMEKNIYSLDLSSIIAGSSFRGEFEGRLKQIIDEIRQNPNIILFIDEIHNIIGAGSMPGSMDAANILKPALAKGSIRCIGATTLSEYKKYLENDSALERRFQPIIVDQPSVAKTIDILKGIKNNYENYHRVIIGEDAINAAAVLSHRYISNKFLPDKAIDLIDEAAAALRITNSAGKAKEIKSMELELEKIKQMKQTAAEAENFDEALNWRQKEIKAHKRIADLKSKINGQKKNNQEKLTAKEISAIVSKITKIPLEDILTEERKRFLNLEKLLGEKIIGQKEAIKIVSEFIRRSRVGIADSKRPIGSFMFLGPSGVGKTETAKIIAQTVFNNDEALIRIDMSEFAESFNASKLIGSPAGYIGYRDSTNLTDLVRKKPYSVVLFDEIEKAHPQIFNLLLQILEDGTLTDATGKKINFRETIIIMTSNIGTEQFNKQSALGFNNKNRQDLEDVKQDVLKKINDFFKTEFLNRVDKTIIFNPLDIKFLTKISKLRIQELSARLQEKNIELNFENSVAKLISKMSYDPNLGARAIRRNILELIENPIAKKLLNSKTKKTFKVLVYDGKIMVE